MSAERGCVSLAGKYFPPLKILLGEARLLKNQPARGGGEKTNSSKNRSRIPSILNSRKFRGTTVHRILFSEEFLEFLFSGALFKILYTPSGG